MRVSRGSVVRIALLLAAAIIIPACGKNDSNEQAIIGILLTKGGAGSAGNGGNGNDIYVEGEMHGDVRCTKNPGSVDATPPAPNLPSPWYGTNPRTVSTTLTLVAPGAGSSPFLGDDGINPATGLRVAAGVCTLNPNNGTQVNLSFFDGPAGGWYGAVVVETGATLQIGRASVGSNNSASVLIYCGAFIVANGAQYNAAGTDNPAGPGGNGGASTIYTGAFVNAGNWDSTGGDGQSGGNGGDNYIEASYNSDGGSIYHTGTFNSVGGVGSVTTGGDGGYCDLENQSYGPLYISGNIYTNGANGATSGGNGDYIYTYTDLGSQFVSSTTNSSGGNGAAGDGGDANYTEFDTGSGESRFTGTHYVMGGTAAGGGFTGGNGDTFYAYNYLANAYIEDNYVSYGMEFAASVNCGGGAGPNGGNAGDVDIEVYDGNGGNNIIKLNLYVSEMTSRGGDGTVNGGDGDWVEIDQYPNYNSTVDQYFGGFIYNDVDWNFAGGNGGTGNGGDGGSTSYLYSYQYDPQPDSVVLGIENHGNFYGPGGNGGTYGGDGGEVDLEFYTGKEGGSDSVWNYGSFYLPGGNGGTLYGGDGGQVYNYVYPYTASNNDVLGEWFYNWGDVYAPGGNGTTYGGYGGYWGNYVTNIANVGSFFGRAGNASAGYGGDGGYFEIYSDYNGVNRADINVSAGDGVGVGGYGGDAGYIYIGAGRLTNAGSLVARGGNSASDQAGDGDYIEVYSAQFPSVLSGTSADCGKGTGAGTHYDGIILIDGFPASSPASF